MQFPEMERKKWEKGLSFEDSCIWALVNKFSFSGTGYFSLAVDILPSNPKI